MSGEPGFSPGPWTLVCGDHSHRYVLVTDERDLTVHYKYGAGDARRADQDEKDAALIAAAPDLYEAMVLAEDILDDLSSGDDLEDDEPLATALRKARAALSKANPNPKEQPNGRG